MSNFSIKILRLVERVYHLLSWAGCSETSLNETFQTKFLDKLCINFKIFPEIFSGSISFEINRQAERHKLKFKTTG